MQQVRSAKTNPSRPLPQAGALITLLDATRPALTGIYLLALRVALMLTLLLAGGHMATAMMTTTPEIHAWLPVRSATRLIGNEGIALALLIGIWSYVTYRASTRLITGSAPSP